MSDWMSSLGGLGDAAYSLPNPDDHDRDRGSCRLAGARPIPVQNIAVLAALTSVLARSMKVFKVGIFSESCREECTVRAPA